MQDGKDIEKYVHIKYKEVSLLLNFNYCLRFTFCNVKKLETFQKKAYRYMTTHIEHQIYFFISSYIYIVKANVNA